MNRSTDQLQRTTSDFILFAMVFVRFIMRPSFVAVLQVLAAVLGVMQVSLSIAIMLGGLRMLGVVAPAA